MSPAWAAACPATGKSVIASEAKQSRASSTRLDCFVAALLAMTERLCVRLRADAVLKPAV
ncbi:hypothetical protein D4Q52_24340 [Rhodopseudomonas palustris]|uniref:Uncharacterized protein n=1 Tax=Rhodopseudomonas palustris TaxID=1076 RepID=A0A418UY00_RHOPL|nr:hypothetical protein D4Q52_24340 [Rhodopseudomonas palustris]